MCICTHLNTKKNKCALRVLNTQRVSEREGEREKVNVYFDVAEYF